MDTTLIREGQRGVGLLVHGVSFCATTPAPHPNSTLSPHACQQTYDRGALPVSASHRPLKKAARGLTGSRPHETL